MQHNTIVVLFLFLVPAYCFEISVKSPDNFTCYTVYEGWHYSDHGTNEIHGFHDSTNIQTQVILDKSCSTYLITADDSDQSWNCMSSWNKLYGSSRCGYLNHHHQDSDRFVWRRVQDCVIIENGVVVGQNSSCEYADYIQVAGYSYDLGNKPFQNDSLLIIFDTLLLVNIPYGLSITFGSDYAQYDLYGSPTLSRTLYHHKLPSTSSKELQEDEQVLLESHVIKHTPCDNYEEGYLLGFYFGGQCVAPQDVTACYSNL